MSNLTLPAHLAALPFGNLPRVSPQIKEVLHLDTAASFALEKELRSVEADLYRQRFPEVMYPSIFPTDFAGPGFKSVGFNKLQEYGAPAWATPGSATPLVNQTRDEETIKVRTKKLGYEYTHQDMLYAARLPNYNLDRELAFTTKRGIDQDVDAISIVGDSAVGVTGLLSSTSELTEATIPADGEGSSTLWSTKSGDQILRDISRVLRGVGEATGGIFSPSVLLLPPAQYDLLKDKYVSTGIGKTVMAHIRENWSEVTIYKVPRLASVSTLSNYAVMVAFPKTKEVLCLKVPVPFMALPGVYTLDHDYHVTCYSDIAGMERKHPKAIVFGKHI